MSNPRTLIIMQLISGHEIFGCPGTQSHQARQITIEILDQTPMLLMK